MLATCKQSESHFSCHRGTLRTVMWKALLLIGFVLATGIAKDCVPRTFGQDKLVCVCNATYCDDMPDPSPKVPKNGSFYWYVSSKSGHRLSMTKAEFGEPKNGAQSDETLTIDPSIKYQKIVGFGGAFTDSAGINIKKLSKATQQQLIRTYFDQKTGSRYALGRVPAGGSDFSTRPYTYDDVPNDTSLRNFSLAPEDHEYKIPFMKEALSLNPNLKFFSAAWTAPAWMKTNNKINGFGFLKSEYYQVYAQYLLKFLEEYKKHGVDIWAISTGNEPINAIIPFDELNTMGWTPYTVGQWIANNLGPTLANSDHNETIILCHDDQRIELPWYVDQIFRNQQAESFTGGIAVHWYTDSFAPPSLLDQTHEHFPNKFILMTEACTGTNAPSQLKVDLGSWDRGQQYILSIIQYLNHWSTGWVDWNLALDSDGGPNWINNNVDSPIIVNPNSDEFYKQPMFYAMAHVSRFVEVGSVRIHITNSDDIKAFAALTPSNTVVVVLYNRSASPKNVSVKDLKTGTLAVELPAYSINTIIYAA